MSSLSREYEEKRDFIRMKVDTPARVSTAGQKPLKGTCRNLSGGGMLIELSSILPVGMVVDVHIGSSHGQHPMLEARARVKRVSAQPESQEPPCSLGLEIVEILS